MKFQESQKLPSKNNKLRRLIQKINEKKFKTENGSLNEMLEEFKVGESELIKKKDSMTTLCMPGERFSPSINESSTFSPLSNNSSDIN